MPMGHYNDIKIFIISVSKKQNSENSKFQQNPTTYHIKWLFSPSK